MSWRSYTQNHQFQVFHNAFLFDPKMGRVPKMENPATAGGRLSCLVCWCDFLLRYLIAWIQLSSDDIPFPEHIIRRSGSIFGPGAELRFRLSSFTVPVQSHIQYYIESAAKFCLQWGSLNMNWNIVRVNGFRLFSRNSSTGSRKFDLVEASIRHLIN